MDYYQGLNQGQLQLKAELQARYVGKSVSSVRTPAFVIDRAVFEKNCAGMTKKAGEWGASFRAHLKTHKTAEGTRLQLKNSEGKTAAVVVSTVKEAWEVWKSGLVKEGIVNDILYGLPIGANKIDDLAELWTEMEKFGGLVRLMVDHPDQVKLLEKFQETLAGTKRRWSVFVKIDGGQNRAGVRPESEELKVLLSTILASSAVELHGFYAHAGNAYGSVSKDEATSYLSSEVKTVNQAATFALANFGDALKAVPHTTPFVLSVGSTPTAHASGAEARALLEQTLSGTLELHAGNYPLLDLQQQHTTLIDYPRIAQRVLATVVSYYPGRGRDGADEALIDAGAIALSKDSGPTGTYGEVIGKPWVLARMSQEHGILQCTETGASPLEVGSVVEIVGQHACLIAAAYGWYFIVDSGVGDGTEIVDVWVPWKGW